MATLPSSLILALVIATVFAAPHVEAITSQCSACRAITTELQTRLDKEKPRNHIDLRHRLDSQGKRYGKSIDYKHSELRAMELLDELCDEVGSYSLYPVDCYASTGMCKPATAKPPPPAPPPSPPPPTTDGEQSSSDEAAVDVKPAVESPPPAEAAPADAPPPAFGGGASADEPDAAKEPGEKPRRRRQWVRTKGLEGVVEKLKLPRDEDAARTKELKNHCGRMMEDHEDALTAAIMRGAFEEPGAAEAFLCYELTKACPSDKIEASAIAAGEDAAEDEQQQHAEL